MSNGSVEAAVNGVILQKVDHIIQIHERIIDSHNLDFRVGSGGAEHQAANATETVNSQLDGHYERVVFVN